MNLQFHFGQFSEDNDRIQGKIAYFEIETVIYGAKD